MQKTNWSERPVTVGLPMGMLPFYLERLAGTVARINNKLKGVPEKILTERLDGKWCIKENLAHLAELNEIAMIRIKEIVNGTPTLTPAHLELKQNYNAQSLESILKYFADTRNKSLEHFAVLVDDELQRSSLHPRFKIPMTPVDLAWFYAEHDDHHLVRINEILTAANI